MTEQSRLNRVKQADSRPSGGLLANTRGLLHVARFARYGIASVLMFGIAFAADGAKADPAKIEVMVSPAGSGPYQAWATLQNYAPDHTDKISLSVRETPGFTYNVRAVGESPDKWKNTVFGSGRVVEWVAANGVKPFFPEPLEAAKDFRVIGVMSQTSNFFVTTNSDIQTVEDFAGKRVATGLLTQNEWGMHHRMMLDAWDITPKLASYDALGSNENIQALLDGKADVGAVVVHSSIDFKHNLEPQPFHTLEASGRDWHYINIPADRIQNYIDETGAPFLVRRVAPGTLVNQGEEELVTFGNFMTLSAHKDFPDELAYEIAKLWIELGPKIGEYSAVAQIWDPQSVTELARQDPDQIHPGALAAYRDLGIVE